MSKNGECITYPTNNISYFLFEEKTILFITITYSLWGDWCRWQPQSVLPAVLQEAHPPQLHDMGRHFEGWTDSIHSLLPYQSALLQARGYPLLFHWRQWSQNQDRWDLLLSVTFCFSFRCPLISLDLYTFLGVIVNISRDWVRLSYLKNHLSLSIFSEIFIITILASD